MDKMVTVDASMLLRIFLSTVAYLYITVQKSGIRWCLHHGGTLRGVARQIQNIEETAVTMHCLAHCRPTRCSTGVNTVCPL